MSATSKVTAVLQARCGSRRLPRKILLDLLGRPMLARQLERIQRASELDGLIVATTTAPDDDAVASLCEELGVRCFRGSVDDVLDRVVRAAEADEPEWLVRLTGDCPLTDPAIIDEAVQIALGGAYDYVSNAISPTYPDGLDVEVVRFRALLEARERATLPSEREHVTPYVHKRPEKFRLGELRAVVDHSGLRWTVDEPADLELVRRIYGALHPANPAFETAAILALLKTHPELASLNSTLVRNEGYALSLKKEQS